MIQRHAVLNKDFHAESVEPMNDTALNVQKRINNYTEKSVRCLMVENRYKVAVVDKLGSYYVFLFTMEPTLHPTFEATLHKAAENKPINNDLVDMFRKIIIGFKGAIYKEEPRYIAA